MPKRNRAREERKAADLAAGVAPPKKASKSKKRKPKKKGPKSLPDPSDTPETDVRYVMSGDTTKAYLCPGCGRDIPPGLSHVVAVPPDIDLRRHWHRGCWDRRPSVR